MCLCICQFYLFGCQSPEYDGENRLWHDDCEYRPAIYTWRVHSPFDWHRAILIKVVYHPSIQRTIRMNLMKSLSVFFCVCADFVLFIFRSFVFIGCYLAIHLMIYIMTVMRTSMAEENKAKLYRFTVCDNQCYVLLIVSDTKATFTQQSNGKWWIRH